MGELKNYLYTRGVDEVLDREFEQGVAKGKVKLGENTIFWKKGLRWYGVKIEQVERIYRRVEEVKSKLCCGSANFDIQKLMLQLKGGGELAVLISEGDVKAAESLYKLLQEKHPQLQYGKVKTVEDRPCGCAASVS